TGGARETVDGLQGGAVAVGDTPSDKASTATLRRATALSAAQLRGLDSWKRWDKSCLYKMACGRHSNFFTCLDIWHACCICNLAVRLL
ncbi:MAG: hypothetical protein K8F26_01815, partial [Thiobacillus sp.]|nr:hypothetical protein [Thiobacillus sp.]